MDKSIDFSGEPYTLAYQNVIYKGPYFHRHALELVFVMCGSIRIEIEGEPSTLRRGDFICINAGETHAIYGDKDSYIVSLYIDLNHYKELHPYIRAFNFYCKYTEGKETDLDRYHAIRNYLIRIMMIETLQIPMHGQLSTELCDIVIEILINHIYDEIYLKGRMSELKKNDRERILSISKYISENYNQRGFSLTQLADHEHLSSTRLSHFWKEMTNISFKDTINLSRFMESKRLLMDGNLSINQIVEQCGYSDEKYLYKIIREKYGMTPSEFRKKHRKTISKPNEYTIKNITDIKGEIIDYSSVFYNRLNDLSFLDERPDKVEEENLNELYAVITSTNKKRANAEKIQCDRTVLSLGLDSGLRYVDDKFFIHWEYIYALGQITTKLFKDCSLAIDVELMSAEEWNEILEEIEANAYRVWGDKFKTTTTLLVTYRVYESLPKARAFAAEVSKNNYFVKAIPIQYL